MEFTKEWIEKCRQKIGFGWSSTGQSTISAIAKLALDEIERLQAERDQVCEWKADRADDYYDTSCNDFYRKKIIDDYLGGKLYCKFCPSCGKRIKYVEKS
jgi:hypothetical protein